MERKRNQKGFTLAELLIVVAIIAVLVAIAIPVFTNQLERSRESTDLANVRSAYAEVITQYLEDNASHEIKVDAKQTRESWNYVKEKSGDSAVIGTGMSGGTGSTSVLVPPHISGQQFSINITASGDITVK